MDKIPWKYIGDWTEKKLTCARCGSKLSVKYEMFGLTYCNRCVIPASYEAMREKRSDEGGATQ